MERLRPREIVIPVVVGLAVAFIQAAFSGADLIRIIVYFFAGIVLAGLALVLYRYGQGRRSRVSTHGRIETESRKSTPPVSPKEKLERIWADVNADDLMAIDNMRDLTRNERDRLLEPYIGQWFRVDGIVDDVHGKANEQMVSVYIRERDHRVRAEFKSDKGRASSLRKGIRIYVLGSLRYVQGYLETMALSDCEFAERPPTARTVVSEPPVAEVEPEPLRDEAQAKTPGSPLTKAIARHGTAFAGAGVGRTPTFHVTKQFGFGWTPNRGIVIGALHGTVNEIPMSWTFDNNMNPYFPAKYAPPPDVPGDYYFSVDNIKAGTPWAITVLHEQPDEWEQVFAVEDEVGPKIDFDKQTEVHLRINARHGTQWRFGLKFSRSEEFAKGRYSSGYPLWQLQKEQDSNDLAFTYYDELGRGRAALLCRDQADQAIGVVLKRVEQTLTINVDCNPKHTVTLDARSHRFGLPTAWADGREFRISVRTEALKSEN
jgi:hypothetical protein